MKKSILNIVATVVLLMLSGCSMESPIKEEQSPITTGRKTPIENNKNLNKYGLTLIDFQSVSTDGDFYPLPNNPITGADRKVLKYGTFFGSIRGYGKIIPSLSRYTFLTLTEEDNLGYPTITIEPKWYKILASGRISLDTNDYCLIDIVEVIIDPHYYVPSSVNPSGHDGAYINYTGTATTHDGVGKLKDLNKTFDVSRGGNYLDTDLSTGQIQLRINEPSPK